MEYRVELQGQAPGLLMHNIDGGFVSSPAKTEMDRLNSLSAKAKKEVANVARRNALEWRLGLYATGTGDEALPTLPGKVLRAAIHGAAKLTKDGQRVNRGMQIVPPVSFSYGADTGKTVGELAEIPHYRHESVVGVQRQRVVRVRPIFPEWTAAFMVRTDPELVSEGDLRHWIETAGRLIGICDWRPDRGGEHGTFELVKFEAVTE